MLPDMCTVFVKVAISEEILFQLQESLGCAEPVRTETLPIPNLSKIRDVLSEMKHADELTRHPLYALIFAFLYNYSSCQISTKTK
jgi:hypothetical protein